MTGLAPVGAGKKFACRKTRTRYLSRPTTATSFHSRFCPFVTDPFSISSFAITMGKKKQIRKFGEVKRMLNPNDQRL